MRFNKKAHTKNLRNRADAIVNHGGGLAFRPSPELDLYLRACAALIEDQFYRSGSKQLAELRKAIHACSRDYVLRLAHYARTEMKLRTLPVILLAEASRMVTKEANESKAMVREYAPLILRRADEPAEVLAYYKEAFGRSWPNALKKGVADALGRFDEYQLAKYDRPRDLKLRDVIRITHPKPENDSRADLYRRAIAGELATPKTWETMISTKGSTAENWNDIAPSMGTMALMRNLRNFEKTGATKATEIARARFRNAEAIRKSRILPFRWLSALEAVSDSKTKDALREAIELSVANVPRFVGSTAIFCDNSGSMHSPLSAKSSLRYIQVASLMGALATHLSSESYLVGAFGQSYADVDVSRRDSVLTNAAKIAGTNVGHSTLAHLAIRSLRERKLRVDRVFVFSDMQAYASAWGRIGESLAEEWAKYVSTVNPNAILYSVDLAGYGSLQWPEDSRNVIFLAGWSERIFELVPMVERGADAVARINERW